VIPDFTRLGVLPPGVHDATWAEISQRFGNNGQRRSVLAGIRQAATALAKARCRRLWIDGSFVTSRAKPKDWDGCWDPVGVVPSLLDPDFLDFSKDGRARMKMKYMADLFPSSLTEVASGLVFLNYFQQSRGGDPKGVVILDLNGWQP
jgi:hypothetical protein